MHITTGPHPNARIKIKPGQDSDSGWELYDKSGTRIGTRIGTGELIMS